MQFPPCGYRLSAKAIITSEKGLLLVREHSDCWDLPVGGVEHAEHPLAALRREIREELGAGMDVTSVKDRPLQVWSLFDVEYAWPLVFVLYAVTMRPGFGAMLPPEEQARFVSHAELRTWKLEPYLEDRREDIRKLIRTSPQLARTY